MMRATMGSARVVAPVIVLTAVAPVVMMTARIAQTAALCSLRRAGCPSRVRKHSP